MVTFNNKPPSWAWKKILSCRINSVEELVSIGDMLGKVFWVFRGHYDSSWKLATSLERSQYHKTVNSGKEKNAIAEFRDLTRHILPATATQIDTLAAMQHYGVPTRLLDFSRSLFVAVYFAFEYSQQEPITEDHCVWAINAEVLFKNAKLMVEKIESELKSVLDNMDEPHSAQTADLIDSITNYAWSAFLADKHRRMETTRKIAENILSMPNSAKLPSGILPIDMAGTNPRMSAQNGMFIMPTDFRTFEENLAESYGLAYSNKSCGKTRFQDMIEVSFKDLRSALATSSDVSIIKFLFFEDLREQINRLLYAANISSAMLFPDLSGIAESITY